MKPTLTMLALIGILALASGCTTGLLKLPGGASLLQPKDVTLEGLEYADGKGATLRVAKYTSSANVAAVQAQTALVRGVVADAVTAGIKAALPVP
ncbi:MAG: hypothetical protein LLG20_01885 [Acidobacteriales bacterium]|nr:hypothetical protein [Terriglobales bacterium]